MRLRDWLGPHQAGRFAVKVKNLSVPPPVHRGFKLPFDFILTEMLVENVVEEFFRNRPIVFRVKNAVDLLQDHDVLEGSLAEENLARQYVSLGKTRALGSNLRVAFLERGKSKQHARLNDGKQVFGIHDEHFRQAIKVFPAAAILQ